MAELKRSQIGKIGCIGEDAAAAYLARNQLEILDRNIRYGKLELDIVFREEKYVVFAEVKTRTVPRTSQNGRFGQPAGAVTYAKQQKLIAAARMYLAEKHPGGYVRFDVIEVFLKKKPADGSVCTDRINHIRNAFGDR